MTRQLHLPNLPQISTWRPPATDTYWNFQPTTSQHSWDVEYYQYYRRHYQKSLNPAPDWEKFNACYYGEGRYETMCDAFEPALDWPWIHALRKGVRYESLEVVTEADAPPREVEVMEIRVRMGSEVRARMFAESNPKVKLRILDDPCADLLW